METILAVGDHGKVTDKVIDAIKKTVRSSVRNRVATNRAVFSKALKLFLQ